MALSLPSWGWKGAIAQCVVLQPDGKLVVGGWSFPDAGSQVAAVVRYQPDGSIDSDFGVDGAVTMSLDPAVGGVYDLALQADGKIVGAGYALDGANSDFLVMRLMPDGSVDPGFGSAGRVFTDFSGTHDGARSIAVQQDGKIVVGGYTDSGVDLDFALARYNTDGTLDTDFSFDGLVTTAVGVGDVAEDLVLLPDSRILAVGYSALHNDGIVAARYHPDGSLDLSWGSDGKVAADLGLGEEACAVALQPDGKALVAGRAWDVFGSDFASPPLRDERRAGQQFRPRRRRDDFDRVYDGQSGVHPGPAGRTDRGGRLGVGRGQHRRFRTRPLRDRREPRSQLRATGRRSDRHLDVRRV